MRNVPLGQIRYAVKAETSRALGSTETAQDAEMNQIIFDMQAWLSSEYDWPFLRSRWDLQTTVSGRYYAFPTVDDVSLNAAINFERPVALYVKWNQLWQPVEYGIRELEEFNYLDPEQGQLSDPVQRWMFDDEGNFEIWPLPGVSSTLRFTGQRALTELRSSVGPPPVWNDNATLDLDDQLVIAYSAAEYLARDEAMEASKVMMQKAQNRMTQIRATYPKRNCPPCRVGMGTRYDKQYLRTVPMVVVAGSAQFAIGTG